jgi:proline iminopeptidase
MKRKNSRLLHYTLLTGLVVFLLMVFLPRNYNVPPLHKRASTQYWQLPTGSRIAYTSISGKGDKNAFPIIYLHGGPGGYISDSLIKSLSPLTDEGYDVYFYDQIGSGLSDRLADITAYTVDRHIQDLAAITRELGVERVILIGQSWGAILATLFTAEYPEKTERLILTSPGPIFPVHRELAALPAPDSLHLRAPIYTNEKGNKKAYNIRTKAIKFFATNFGWKLSSEREADDFATYLNYEVDKSTVCDTTKILAMEAGGGFYSGIMTFKNLIKRRDSRPKIHNLQTTTLVMKGQCDNQPWGYTNEYLTVFQHHKLTIIPGAGHFLWVEQPELYVRAIKEFLSHTIPAPNSAFKQLGAGH